MSLSRDSTNAVASLAFVICVSSISKNSDNSKLSQKKSGVIYFYDKESAVSYRKQMVEKNPELESYQIVGLDELFWKELKPCLQIKKMGMIFLSGNSDEGIWYDLEQFEYLQMCGMK